MVILHSTRTKMLPVNTVPVNISLWVPRGWCGITFPELAPTASVLREYWEHLDWAEYRARYGGEVLARLNPVQTALKIQRMCGDKTPVLICTKRESHSLFVAEWLKLAGIQVKKF